MSSERRISANSSSLTATGYEDLNMKEIGGILGITESRVCQIHTKAAIRLRGKLKGVLDR